MLRQIQPWSGNTKKRLVKAPKIYFRDCGLLHQFLNISDFESLLGHPIIGASWEGFVIENIINNLSNKWKYSYYRTNAQSEIDLVLEGPKKTVYAIEIKRSSTPKIAKGFYTAIDDIKATHKYIICPTIENYMLKNDIQITQLSDFLSNQIFT